MNLKNILINNGFVLDNDTSNETISYFIKSVNNNYAKVLIQQSNADSLAMVSIHIKIDAEPYFRIVHRYEIQSEECINILFNKLYDFKRYSFV